MERDEMIRYIEFLQERLDEEKRARELSDKRVFDLLGKIDRMGEQHSHEMQSMLQKNQELQQSIMDMTSAIRLNKKNRFASTSQKMRSMSKKDEQPPRDEEREDHDGTPPNASSSVDVEVEETTEAAPEREAREIAALQSDAYNVYMFIDKELENVTHLCCMAHARAKFIEALEQGRDERARLFVDSNYMDMMMNTGG